MEEESIGEKGLSNIVGGVEDFALAMEEKKKRDEKNGKGTKTKKETVKEIEAPTGLKATFDRPSIDTEALKVGPGAGIDYAALGMQPPQIGAPAQVGVPVSPAGNSFMDSMRRIQMLRSLGNYYV